MGLRLEKNNKSALETMKRPKFEFNEKILFHLLVQIKDGYMENYGQIDINIDIY